eukprot:3010249-Rhodomonas_salina.1
MESLVLHARLCSNFHHGIPLFLCDGACTAGGARWRYDDAVSELFILRCAKARYVRFHFTAEHFLL